MLKEKLVSRLPNIALFIDQAELAWGNIVNSAEGGREIKIGGFIYRKLPIRFNTRLKIFDYFRRFWSIEFSRRMLCNLKTIFFKGHLYVRVGDIGAVPIKVVSFRILTRTDRLLRIRAILSGSDKGNTVIFYSIKRSPNNLTIILRSKSLTDVRYRPCR
ncbi:DL-endopeptidase inhibitor IseA family protein [Paenibacillus psychroresistens]|uniref:DL-endopeptidase inhibitor IseA family protein n=1 Tax=Paenibacillus psychroresistens TaxID=1778678 RepID=UPI001391DCE6|nr:DL-endopeptidase inhibitor IseA family protein [Paenibacillus psychroresistens]